MNEQMKRCAVGLMALGLTSSFSLVAAAQEIDDDGYVIEERYLSDEPDPPAVMFDDDDDDDDDDEVRVVYQGGMQRCAATFRSFDPATGTYVGYDGLTRLCPYLD
jgi:hypothetical protein